MADDPEPNGEEMNAITKRPRRTKRSNDFLLRRNQSETRQISSKMKSERIENQINGGRDPPDPFEIGEIVWTKLHGYPWWPALIFGCFSENGTPHTKIVGNWVFTASLLKYSGLKDFIQNAETAVQQTTSKLEQEKLANRYQLKVSVQSRLRWDGAIADADRALSMPKEKRIEEFGDLIKDILAKAKGLESDPSTNVIELDNEATNKKLATTKQRSSTSSRTSSVSRKIIPQRSPTKKTAHTKRSPTSLAEKNPTKSSSNSRLSTNNESKINKSNQLTVPTTNNTTPFGKRKWNSEENAGDCIVTSETTKKLHYMTSNDISPLSLQHDIANKTSELAEIQMTSLHAGLPMLTKYEEKKIADDLINYLGDQLLTLDDAQTFACEQAMEIINENFGYRMSCVQVEWFYDLLLKHPQIFFKHHHWFDHHQLGTIPTHGDPIDLKRWECQAILLAQMLKEKEITEDSQQQQNLRSSRLK
ncbi:unnamed protein product [Didymodactylos carnosus]|uniref:PWWP domain-containing protein n=1 Tax=Didymodactylos carnosus TaxID=1234261 RepID=A0A813R6J9_9BILA|nr:unnamed protein product [Didymodactylos carnosus]CAF0925337.1 unnamed protein product [Didymodactylos carnosus]CAF3559262.1 unnamed protein product [Didymodactylos carnosus]CAF3702463.1 unnamed protein product [Didymodactylos carnosus]